MASYDRPAAFRIGRVFGDTFSVFGRNFGICIALAAIFYGVPWFLYQLWAGTQTDSMLVSAEAGAPPASIDGTAFLAGFVVFAIYLVLVSILQAALVRMTIEDLNGQQPTFGDALTRGLAVVLPVIGLSILVYLGIMVGLALLIIPGIILFVRWSAAVPVLVQERLGVVGSMKRSAELTKGNRWRILGLIIIFYLAMIVIMMLLATLTFAMTSFGGIVVGAALNSAVSTISTVLGSIAMAVSYVELRYVKEGTDVKQLAEIFA